MKRLCAFLLSVAVVLTLSTAFAKIPDIDGLTMEELTTLQESILKRIDELKEKNNAPIQIDADGIEIIKDIVELSEFSDKLSIDSSYVDLYRCFVSVQYHMEEYPTVSKALPALLDLMKYGNWSDGTHTITFSAHYEDYNNTSLSQTFSTNMENSKIKGQTYYFYSEYVDSSIIIGYSDKVLGEKTPNYKLSFSGDSILVHSYVEDADFVLMRDKQFNHITRDNAKNAYVYIANVMKNFKFPQTFEVVWCVFDSNKERLYMKCNSNNSAGGVVTKLYSIMKSDSSYTLLDGYDEYNYSNVNIPELNENIQEYVKKMYR